MNYTDSTAIAAYLGVTFTTEQAAAADAVGAAVTVFIDRYVGRSWQATSPVAGELDPVLPARTEYPGASGVAYLQHTPAVSVQAVSTRTPYPNGAETPLDPAEYELLDPVHGVLTLVGWPWSGGLLAVVDYTFAAAVPADITLAATMIASAEMARELAIQSAASASAAHPERDGIKSVSIGQNAVAVTYTDGASAATLGGGAAGSAYAPPGSAARAILDGYRRVVIA